MIFISCKNWQPFPLSVPWPDHHRTKFFVAAHNCYPIPSNVPSRLQLTTKSVAKYAGTYQMSAGHPVWFTVVIVPPALIGPDITTLSSDWLSLTWPRGARAPRMLWPGLYKVKMGQTSHLIPSLQLTDLTTLKMVAAQVWSLCCLDSPNISPKSESYLKSAASSIVLMF